MLSTVPKTNAFELMVHKDEKPASGGPYKRNEDEMREGNAGSNMQARVKYDQSIL